VTKLWCHVITHTHANSSQTHFAAHSGRQPVLQINQNSLPPPHFKETMKFMKYLHLSHAAAPVRAMRQREETGVRNLRFGATAPTVEQGFVRALDPGVVVVRFQFLKTALYITKMNYRNCAATMCDLVRWEGEGGEQERTPYPSSWARPCAPPLLARVLCSPSLPTNSTFPFLAIHPSPRARSRAVAPCVHLIHRVGFK
jgi:hypothetical protein